METTIPNTTSIIIKKCWLPERVFGGLSMDLKFVFRSSMS